LIASSALKAGFTGGVVVDYPNSSKAKKHYLCLSFERSYNIPTAIEDGKESEFEVDQMGENQRRKYVKRKRRNQNDHTTSVKSADWIKRKKEKHRRRGKEVKRDSKYTGRRRKSKRF